MRRYAGAEPVTAVTPPADYLKGSSGEVLGTVVTGGRRTFEVCAMDGGVDSLDPVSLGSWGDHGRLSEIAAVTL